MTGHWDYKQEFELPDPVRGTDVHGSPVKMNMEDVLWYSKGRIVWIRTK